ncbi:hypothetical protein MSSIT_1474 [Methanosarcina siciliae T4/M]|uniref:Uncharacterized protein n=2 Tax=Methanosarcina siciliae TaxID=38027 RepID=A0A0E3PDA3_9EURY|nr:hypothetical protein MSSIT_1474 [Methanosarcina siciliae T4/M]AKB32113.1 hypothetical protein MSSIH_1423 [Methanosarcina siciliae HI350]
MDSPGQGEFIPMYFVSLLQCLFGELFILLTGRFRPGAARRERKTKAPALTLSRYTDYSPNCRIHEKR